MIDASSATGGVQTFADAWEAIADTPGEAAGMRLRAELMLAITRRVRSWKLTQRKAAERLGVTQPRLNELLTGKYSRFSLDALVALADRTGITMEVTFRNETAVMPRRGHALRRRPPAVSKRRYG